MKIMTESGEIKEALFDGYAIAERLLEGVKFRVVMTSKGLSCPGVRDEDKSYMEQFSTKQMREWRQRVLESVSFDGGMETATGEEAWVEVEDDPYLAGILGREPEVRQIRVKKIDDIMEIFKAPPKSG